MKIKTHFKICRMQLRQWSGRNVWLQVLVLENHKCPKSVTYLKKLEKENCVKHKYVEDNNKTKSRNQ